VLAMSTEGSAHNPLEGSQILPSFPGDAVPSTVRAVWLLPRWTVPEQPRPIPCERSPHTCGRGAPLTNVGLRAGILAMTGILPAIRADVARQGVIGVIAVVNPHIPSEACGERHAAHANSHEGEDHVKPHASEGTLRRVQRTPPFMCSHGINLGT
jgi:hypothetical protein